MALPYVRVQKPEDIPVGHHWAIITFGTIHIPGDERSRTNPGHGYGPSTEITTEYKLFALQKDWLAEIKRLETPRLHGPPEKYIALAVERPSIGIEVQIKIG